MTQNANNIYDTAVKAMFDYEETREFPASGDDLVIWPDGDSCNAEDLSGMGHKSDDYIRVPIDSNAYDIVSFELRRAA